MNRDYVRLTASAANPDRHEQGWEPGYNLVELAIQTGASGRTLDVKAHVRVWQTGPDGFNAKRDRKGVDYFGHTLTLENWRPLAAPANVSHVQPPSTIESEAIPVEDGDAMDTLRDLGLRFYRLSFSKKSEIAGRLDLLQEDDMRLPDHERFRLVIIRAHERGQLDALRDAVSSAEQG